MVQFVCLMSVIVIWERKCVTLRESVVVHARHMQVCVALEELGGLL